MHKLLEAMGSEACLPVELFEIIQNVLLRRAKDIKVCYPFCILPWKIMSYYLLLIDHN